MAINPSEEGGDLRHYGVITHPGGDQTFVESEGSWKMDNSVAGFNWSFELSGRFVGGTGKFERIRALWHRLRS